LQRGLLGRHQLQLLLLALLQVDVPVRRQVRGAGQSALTEAGGLPYRGAKGQWRWTTALFEDVLGAERTTHRLGLDNRAAVVATAADGDAAFAEILEVRPGSRRLALAPALDSGRCPDSGQLERDRGGGRRDVRNCGRTERWSAGRQQAERLRAGGSIVWRRCGAGGRVARGRVLNGMSSKA
jgi:hypothetical protein